MNKTASLIQLWEEGRTRFSGLLPSLREEDLLKHLPPSPNTIGYLVQHIAEVEMMFARNVFGLEMELKVHTVGPGPHPQRYSGLEQLVAFTQLSHHRLLEALQRQPDEAWEKEVTAPPFGTRTLQQALGRIISHTGYHSGQIGMVLKYGIPLTPEA